MSPSSFIRNVAIVGAGGHIGSHMTRQLLATGRHTVTAITRAESKSQFADGVVRAEIDYAQPDSMVNALKGQDCLIITLAFGAAPRAQDSLIEAAAQAGVPWILPNEWAPDSMHTGLAQDISSLSDMPRIRDKIKQLGKSSYISVMTGLWYEWCLATPVLFGIDCLKKEAVLFDEGETKISTSTWPQIGRAVAALLSLPVKRSETAESETCLNDFRNGPVYVSSFNISQKEMLESAVKERFEAGLEARRVGVERQKGRFVYSRVFFPDGAGNHEDSQGVANGVLGLPKEQLDESTKLAVEMQFQDPSV